MESHSWKMSSDDQIVTAPRRASGPTPFSFHCTICFEKFDNEERYPVVLPCGHTYLCAKCSKRIKKCMECRTPLFMLKPVATPVSGSGAQNACGRASPIVTRGRRYAAPSPPPTPPQSRQEIPLPLPRNVLLLSLMETAEREANAVRCAKLKQSFNITNSVHRDATGSSFQGSINFDMNPIDETVHMDDTISLVGECIDEDFSATFSFEEDEDAYIWSSISHISSTCGTYAVTDPAGLIVLPRKPGTSDTATNSSIPSVYKNIALTNGKDYIDPPTPYELPHRGRVQVVNIEDGWVQLARNQGYIYADSNQLVKVGGPSDKACEVEGMLLQVDNRRKEISQKQSELSRIESGLERELDRALLNHFADTKKYVLDDDIIGNDASPDTLTPGQKLSTQQEESTQEQEQNSPKSVKNNNSRIAFPRTPPSRKALRTPSPTQSPALVTRLLGLPKLSLSPVPANNSNDFIANTFPPPLTTLSNRRSIRAHPVSPSSVDKPIDFRTGFSGHCALTQSFARHPHPDSRSGHRMMGEHKGLGLRSSHSWRSTNTVLTKSPDSARNTVDE